ncbi:6136_t:CDS:2, partial [Ambispora gerdemannii]
MQTLLKNDRFDELEALRKKLDLSFGTINERVASCSGGGWLVRNKQQGFSKLNIGMNFRFKRKLTHNDKPSDSEKEDDNINNTNVKFRRKVHHNVTVYEDDDEQDKDSKFVAIAMKNRNKTLKVGNFKKVEEKQKDEVKINNTSVSSESRNNKFGNRKNMDGDFLSVYLSERNNKKKKKNNQQKNDDSEGHHHSSEKGKQIEKNLNQMMDKKKDLVESVNTTSTITTFMTTPLDLSKLKWKTTTTMNNSHSSLNISMDGIDIRYSSKGDQMSGFINQ